VSLDEVPRLGCDCPVCRAARQALSGGAQMDKPEAVEVKQINGTWCVLTGAKVGACTHVAATAESRELAAAIAVVVQAGATDEDIEAALLT